MPTTNPHERRDRPAENNYMELVRGPYDVLEDGKRAYPGFSLARLEELLRDEFARGFNCGEGTMERRVEENLLPNVRRREWDAGYAAGRRDLIDEQAARLALPMRGVHDRARALLDEAAADKSKVSRKTLERELEDVLSWLAALLASFPERT